MSPSGPDTAARRETDTPERPALDVVDALPVAVVLSRVADGYIIYSNLATVGLVGADGPQDIVGRPISRFIDAEDVDRFDGYVRTVGGGERGDNRFRIHRMDGSHAVVEIHPMSFEHRGEPVLLSVIIDATDRVAAEREIAAAEERYRTLVAMAPEGIGVQQDGRYVLVNDELVRLFGADSADEIIGTQVIDYIAPEEREDVSARMRATTAGGPGTFRTVFGMRGLDGRPFRAEISCRRMEYGEGVATQAIIRELPPEE